MRHGPWSSALLEAVGGSPPVSETSLRPLRDGFPRVEGLSVVPGTIAGRVDGCDATLTAELVPQRRWAAMWRFARGNAPLEAAVAGREQSDHLDHLMREDWDAPLVPAAIGCSCSCDGPGTCVHVVALARAAADAIDADASFLLAWRGCTPERGQVERNVDGEEPTPAPPEQWLAGELPEPRPARPLPPGAVLKRLGPAGVRVGDRDLVDALQRAYDAFGSMPQEAENVSPGASDSSPSPD